MARRLFLTILCMLIIGICVLGAGALAQQGVSVFPQKIEADSACPATGCASGSCHGFDNIPEPDGVTEMRCPEASCSSVECHAWGELTTRYRQASDASLNVWILMPVALVIALITVMRKVR